MVSQNVIPSKSYFGGVCLFWFTDMILKELLAKESKSSPRNKIGFKHYD